MVRFFIEARTWDSTCPAQVLAQTNAILRRLPGRVALVTAFLGVIDGGLLRYANAGHVPPLVVDGADAGPEPVELRTSGLPLGVVDDLSFVPRELAFDPQHLLFAATDGLLEARRAAELFGQERVTAIVAAHAPTMSTQDLVELAYSEVQAFADVLSDDVAIIALRPT